MAAQYAALAAFVVAEAIIFVPLLFMAQRVAPGAIQSAGLVTHDRFRRPHLRGLHHPQGLFVLGWPVRWGLVVALVLIAGSVIFGFYSGTWFSVAMVGLAGIAILRDTSDVLHRYPEDRYVGAALQLFASVALMLWYVLRIFMSRD